MVPVKELWAVLDRDGNVMWSRGGSSTKKSLMVYPTEHQAERALKNPWIKQVIPDRRAVTVAQVYAHREGGQ